MPFVKEITPDMLTDLERWAKAGAETGEIALALGVPEKYLGLHYGKLLAQYNAHYRLELRVKQSKLAGASSHMGIHLGKNVLGQKDKTDLDVNVKASWGDFVRTATKNKDAPVKGRRPRKVKDAEAAN